MSTTKPKADPTGIQRGDYSNPKLSPALFFIGRLMNIPIQLAILTSSPFSNMFPRPPPPSGGAPILRHIPSSMAPFLSRILPLTASATTVTLTLTPYQAIITTMSAVLVAKHLIWIAYLRRERLTWQFAFFGTLPEWIFEGLENLLFTFAAVNPFWSPSLFYLAAAMHIPAVLLELTAEIQRKIFKDDPKNKGKLCTTGPWGLARHINYGCNIIYGFAYGMACGGIPAGIIFGGVYLLNFVFNAGPSIEEYCQERYREKFDAYCKKVPYKYIPWLF
ncbi:hypothetical protein BP5796_07488 [Coleophoma crateriformis]|uniref:Delta(14)-sterol reductase n=1 Tax=Coleophoma crateriformis TaxID=565419 RepID=A0A3D8RJA6_9HELO|nr:hypothetical protein BP5796_07488 [Coleophoma crateriformis]